MYKIIKDYFNDTIAVIYELDGLKRKAIKPKKGIYYLEEDKRYLIVCGKSDYFYENGNKELFYKKS